MKQIISLIFLLAFSLPAFSQTHSVFHIGHSLVSPYMPAMLNSLADSTPSVTHSYNYGVINGSPLFWAWEMRGKYPNILDHPEHGQEARKLFDDAQKLLSLRMAHAERTLSNTLLTSEGVVEHRGDNQL